MPELPQPAARRDQPGPYPLGCGAVRRWSGGSCRDGAPGPAVSRGPDRLAGAAGRGAARGRRADDRTYGLLQALLALAAEDTTGATQHQRLESELAGLRALQEQLRQNLQALGGSEREVTLRDQLLHNLAASEARRRAIGELVYALEQAATARAARRQALLDALYAPAAAGES